MNCEVCQLKELEVEHFEIREVLRCILHTILFHRALGLVRPKDVDLELFEITYVQCGDMELEKKVDEKIEDFISWVEKHPNKKSQFFRFSIWNGHDKENAPIWAPDNAKLIGTFNKDITTLRILPLVYRELELRKTAVLESCST